MKRFLCYIAVMVLAGGCVPAGVPGSGIAPSEKVRQSLSVFVVDLGGTGGVGKAIGCGDMLVPMTRVVETPDQGIASAIKAALNELFSLPEEDLTAAGRYSVFPQMQLRAISARISDRTAIVELEGTPQFGGVCDTPRFYEQIDATIRQFHGIAAVEIRLNGSAENYLQLGNLK